MLFSLNALAFLTTAWVISQRYQPPARLSRIWKTF
jgi:hypothetical protein